MIYLVHGEDLSYSRKIILNQQKKLDISKRFETTPSATSPGDLIDSLTTNDLFGEPPFVLLDISGAGKTDLEPYVKIMDKVPLEATLIILASKDLPKTHPVVQNSGLLNIKIVKSEKRPSSNIFKFVDNVFTGNRKAAYQEMEKLLGEGNDPFYIFSMLLYGLRKNKNKYGKDKLRNLFNEIYEIEKKVKTGNISQDIFIPYTMEKIFYAQLQTTQI